MLALIYVATGATLESFGLVLIIPLVAVVIGGRAAEGHTQQIINAAFASLGVNTPLGKLEVVLGGFVFIMIVRGVVIALRDTTLNSLQTGYI